MEPRVRAHRDACGPRRPRRDLRRPEVLHQQHVPVVALERAVLLRHPAPNGRRERAVPLLLVVDREDRSAPRWRRIARLEERAASVREREPERRRCGVSAVRARCAGDARAEPPLRLGADRRRYLGPRGFWFPFLPNLSTSSRRRAQGWRFRSSRGTRSSLISVFICAQASRASSTEPSSSMVGMSPGSLSTVTAFSTRRMILPLRVFGSMSTKLDRKSTRLNSSHLVISYAVFCLKK